MVRNPVNAFMPPQSESLHHALYSFGSENPDAVALLFGDESWTYSRILQASQALSQELRTRHGIEPGDRVGLLMRNRPEFVVAAYGILAAGAVLVPINNFLKPGEVIFIARDAELKAVVSNDEWVEFLDKVRSQMEDLTILNAEGIGGPSVGQADTGSGWEPRTREDLGVIVYTSGTTGQPKGAMLSHGNLLHNVESCRQVLELIQGDRLGVMLPLFHSFMMTVGMFLPLSTGGSLVLVKSLHPPKNALKEILEHQATILPAVPQFFRAMAMASATLPSESSLRVCISGGAPLPGEVLREFESRIPIPLIEGYGLSEASPVVSLNPIHGIRKPGSIGLPIANVEISIRNDAFEELPPGEHGEIAVRGGNVMLGYWKRPEATAEALKEGWLITGDIGYRDQDGYFYVTDRKKDMLIVNGINVYPREIEEQLYRLEGILEAAVVGIPDRRKGETPAGFVVLAENTSLSTERIIEFLRQQLADYKVPRTIRFMDKLPRTPTGKILKRELAKILEEERKNSG